MSRDSDENGDEGFETEHRKEMDKKIRTCGNLGTHF